MSSKPTNGGNLATYIKKCSFIFYKSMRKITQKNEQRLSIDSSQKRTYKLLYSTYEITIKKLGTHCISKFVVLIPSRIDLTILKGSLLTSIKVTNATSL